MERPVFRLKCHSVVDRQGFIEVIPGIHSGCINIETWNIHPETDLTGVGWVGDSALTDADCLSNCELELSIDVARNLANTILEAIRFVESSDSTECDECGST